MRIREYLYKIIGNIILSEVLKVCPDFRNKTRLSTTLLYSASVKERKIIYVTRKEGVTKKKGGLKSS